MSLRGNVINSGIVVLTLLIKDKTIQIFHHFTVVLNAGRFEYSGILNKLEFLVTYGRQIL